MTGNPKKRRSISFYVGGFVSAAFIYVGFVTANDFITTQDERINHLERKAIQLTDATSDYFQSKKAVFSAISESDCVRNGEPGPCSDMFGRLNKKVSNVVNFAATDKTGRFFASGKPFDRSNPPSLAKHPMFKELASGKPQFVMNPHIGPISGIEVTGLVIPRLDPKGAFNGLIGVSIKLGEINTLWRHIFDRDSSVSFLIIDRNQIVIAASNDLAALTKKNISEIGNLKEVFESNPPKILKIANLRMSYFKMSEQISEWSIVALTPSIMNVGSYVSSSPYILLLGAILVVLALVVIIFFFRDAQVVSRLQASEKGLREAHDELEERVLDRTKKLEVSEAKYREIIEGTEDLITIVDGEGRFLFINGVSNIIFGLPPEDCIGRRAFDFIHPDDKEPTVKAFQGWLADKKSTVTFENRQVSVTGEIHSMLWAINFHYDEAGNIKTVNSIARDITDRMIMEEELRKALVDAERANQAKSEFLASMSHELRTPLNAVLGFAQMMQFDQKNPLTPEQKEYTDDILEGGNHLLGLVNEILDLARVEADQIELSLSDVDAKAAVASCVGLITPLGEPRRIKIIDQFSNGSSTLLLTDYTRLKQALINLLSNAVKFNKDGGTVTIDGKEVVPGFLRISVTDTGKGIPEDDHSSVFHLFHRLDADPMVATEGTGIGLTVTKMLVERLAGRIGFESKVGVGSTFWIDLPLASNENVLIWSDAMRVGVDAIDRDHQVLISLLNRIMRRSASDADIDDVIDELVDYTRYHFEREEALMEVCEYPDIKKHRVLHRKLVDEVIDHKEAWSKELSQESLIQFRKFFKNWLFDHILEQDTKIQPFTKGKGQEIKKSLEGLG